MPIGLTISRAAMPAGVGVETIRSCERRGLIKQPPRPRNGGFRCYNDAVVDRIRFIRQARGVNNWLTKSHAATWRAPPGCA